MLVELARVGRAKQRLIDDRDLLDAAHGALEAEAFAFGEQPLPAAFGFLRKGVEAAGDVLRGGRGLLRIAEDFRRQHPGDCRLLDDMAAVAAVQAVQDVADRARLLDEGEEIVAGALFAAGEPKHRVLEPGRDEKVLQRALVLEILLGLAA